MFCSKAMPSFDGSEAVGIEDIHLRHPRTHALGQMTWRISFPVDLSQLMARRREAARVERMEWDLVRYRSTMLSKASLLDRLSFTES